MVRLNIIREMGLKLSLERWIGLLDTGGELVAQKAGNSLSHCMVVLLVRSVVWLQQGIFLLEVRIDRRVGAKCCHIDELWLFPLFRFNTETLGPALYI